MIGSTQSAQGEQIMMVLTAPTAHRRAEYLAAMERDSQSWRKQYFYEPIKHSSAQAHPKRTRQMRSMVRFCCSARVTRQRYLPLAAASAARYFAYRRLALTEQDKAADLLLKLADECDRGVLCTADWLSAKLSRK
jgi:hypothetical protein